MMKYILQGSFDNGYHYNWNLTKEQYEKCIDLFENENIYALVENREGTGICKVISLLTILGYDDINPSKNVINVFSESYITGKQRAKNVKKIYKNKHSEPLTGICPDCGAILSYGMHKNFCSNCGCKLDWCNEHE